MEDYYWESRLPYEIHIADKDGLIDMVDRYESEWEARKAIPALLEEARTCDAKDEYQGTHFALVKFEFFGMTDWQEPIENFPVFA
jgi:hypothetical protein